MSKSGREPDFLSQNGDLSDEATLAWYIARRKEATAAGATWHRFSRHPELRDLILYEGWRECPVDENGDLDEGQPRWQISDSRNAQSKAPS
jgi:hypothetical protein